MSKPLHLTLKSGGALLLAISAVLSPWPAAANPSHPVVTQGSATFSSQGSKLTIQTGGNSVINWSSFNIGAGQSTVFVQPSATSVVWNHITDPNPTQILGHLDANGLVVLQNQSGFFIGGNAVINAAGLVMTTTPAVPLDVFGGGAWVFTAPPPTASIINYGEINGGPAGSVFLISHDIENHGSITAPGGSIGLCAGEQVLMSTRADGRGFSAEVTLPQGSVDNSGKLIADAGTIALNAQVVNQGGLIQANSVREQNGFIEVVASDSVTFGAVSTISAKGDTQGASAGGKVTIKSGDAFSDAATSVIDVSGGAQGGAGGQLEISATQLNAIQSQINGHAEAGWTGGKLIIDPMNITLSTTGSSASSGTVNDNLPGTGTLTLNPNSLNSFSQILLQASGNITLSSSWTVPDISSAATLTLQAANNITLNNNLEVGKNWSVNLIAGANFNPNAPLDSPACVTPGIGTVTLSGTAVLQAENGNINVMAGNSVLIGTQNGNTFSPGSGAIRTLGVSSANNVLLLNGGSINVDAVTGNVNTGNNTTGYNFNPNLAHSELPGFVSSSLGGISTGAGGNVTITAGGNITSLLPTGATDAGSGAFGPEPGVVTITAGGSVYGHYVAADSQVNGVAVPSTITAENGNAGFTTATAPLLALSLATGSWVVNAPNGSINLQEVRNPNGALNDAGTGATALQNNVFNYSREASVTLDAGNAVNLLGSALPRNSGDLVPCIYPPSLTINTGAGGVTLANDVTLFPSPDGELTINTTVPAGTAANAPGTPPPGSFEGNNHALAMSDSGSTRWVGQGEATASDFANEHAAMPVQLNNSQPVVLNIAGDLDNVSIISPKATQATVGGSMNNLSFTGQNLHRGDTTFFHVAGGISYQNTYAFVSLSTGLPLPAPLYPGAVPDYLQLLENAVVPGSGPSSPNAGALFPSLNLFYLPGTQQLGYNQIMDAGTESLLLGTHQEKTYTLGVANVNAQGNYITTPVTFAPPSSPLYTAIQKLYTASQNSINLSSAPQGIMLGGPGALDITAQSMNLGVATEGVGAVGPFKNHNLTKIASQGASINIDLTGDLDMFASQISSWYGGAMDINVGGAVNAGLANLPFQDPNAPHGIWSSAKSDISVIAQGNINIDGSRIAAFDGGNIFVESLAGNVNAGTGNLTQIQVNEVVVVNPFTGDVQTPQQPIAGSGILAATLPDAPPSLAVGNITVLTPKGNIEAAVGGITQQPQNGNNSILPTVSLSAGSTDPNTGKVTYVGNIEAGDTGIIAINTDARATGKVTGLFISSGNSTIRGESINVTDMAGGTASLNANGGAITGTVIAGGSINVAGGAFAGVALSQNVSGGGAQSALASAATSSAGSQNSAAGEASSQKAETSEQPTDTNTDDEKKRPHPMLAKYTGRVTVLLPPRP